MTDRMSALQSQSHAGTGIYKRASRKGAARRYACTFPACDKVYSRQEHLQRHQLNHNPREIFICDVENCGQKFVRTDLLARHKKRHSSSYTPRNRIQSFNEPENAIITSLSIDDSESLPSVTSAGRRSSVNKLPASGDSREVAGKTEASSIPIIESASGDTGAMQVDVDGAITAFAARAPSFTHPSPSVPRDAAILLTPESVTEAPPAATTGLVGHDHHHLPQHPPPVAHQVSAPWPAIVDVGHPDLAFPNMQFGEVEMTRDNFAMWLFDKQTNYDDFNVAHLPFLEGGLESSFNNNIAYDYESLTSHSHADSPPRQPDNSEEVMTEFRRQELLHIFLGYRARRPEMASRMPKLGQEVAGDLPALNLELMHDCLYEYWEHIAPRVPIIHQPTFSYNIAPPLLLLVMIALGAASLHSHDGTGNLGELAVFADIIITDCRWDILPNEDASPPVSLWVAQALLLLEFYEKMYSSRRFHERANIYHSVTLTLLRRGSPLIGRSGSESPPDEAAPIEPTDHQQSHSKQHGSYCPDSLTWWTRWAETESMHRVVFAAFCFDITHAAMFGHAADMAPHEIRLPLPCDDNLWAATKPDDVRQLDANLRMYGVKPIFFLDGLKRALHGKEVKTHSFGRMIIMCGLLSVGWHLNRRETHLKWLDLSTPSSETQDHWRKMLLRAFDIWKGSFDVAQGAANGTRPLTGDSAAMPTVADGLSRRGSPNGPIQNASVLYHLAHISLHVDIVDCQVYAGAKHLVGRKVSNRDYKNVVSRMKAWSLLPSTRHAVLHAFRLLRHVLVDPRKAEKKRHRFPGSDRIDLPPIETQTYSCRTESDPHRPWIMYYATLSIWAFFRAINHGNGCTPATPFDGTQQQPQIQLPQNQYNSYSQLDHTAQQIHPPNLSTTHVSPHLHSSSPQSYPSLQRQQNQGQQQVSYCPQPVSNFVNRTNAVNQPHLTQVMSPAMITYQRVVAYLTRVAELPQLGEAAAIALGNGLTDLLDYLHNVFGEAHFELLQEAHVRLKVCRDIMLSKSG